MHETNLIPYYKLMYYVRNGEPGDTFAYGEPLHKLTEINFPEKCNEQLQMKPDNERACVVVWLGTLDDCEVNLNSDRVRDLTYQDFLLYKEYLSGPCGVLPVYIRPYAGRNYAWEWPEHYKMWRKPKKKVRGLKTSEHECSMLEKEYGVKIKRRKLRVAFDYDRYSHAVDARSHNGRSWKSKSKKKKQYL